MTNQIYFCQHAYLPSGWAEQVKIEVVDGYIKTVVPNSDSRDCTTLDGPVLPTVANLHSHSFQYVMAGLAEVSSNSDDSFWSWRDLMYKLVGRLTPDDVRTISTRLYIDMLKAGYTQVGEFHYLNHQPDGRPYSQVTEMADQVLAAANGAGIGLTLLPALYSYSGFGGKAPQAAQARFVQNSDQYLHLFKACEAKLSEAPLHRIGVCFHSLRAVTEQQIKEVLAGIGDQVPIHIHISEQEKEVNDCVSWSGQRPVEWLSNKVDLNRHWCLVHATHINSSELKTIAQSEAVVGICPTTEANLGDGIFPAVDYIKNGGIWGIGSDSHVSVSITDELRSLEYSQRLRDRQRNRLHHDEQLNIGDFLLRQANLGGNRACGVDIGLKPGQRADFMVLDQSHPFIGAGKPADIINRWIFAANENLVKHVYVAGKAIVQDFRHPLEAQSRQDFGRVIKRLMGDL